MVASFEEREMTPFEIDVDGRTVIIDGTTVDLELRPAPVIPRKLDCEVAFVTKHGHTSEDVRDGGFEEVVI